MTLRKKAVSSLAWLALLRYSTRAIDFLKIVILTRVITQADFGNFALAVVTVNTLEALADTGFSFAFIHLQGSIKHYAKTLWVTSIIRGLALALVIIALAFLLPIFFHSPSLTSLILLSALIPAIKGFQSPFVIAFQKELTFKKEFFFRILPYITTSLCSLFLTIILRNPIGLLYGMIIGSIVETIFSFVVTKTTFPYPFDKKKAVKLFTYGKFLTGSSIFTFLMTEVDTIFVGRVFGPTTLGLYDLTFKLANIVFSEITDIVSRVAFPLYAKIQKNIQVVRKTFFLHFLLLFLPSAIISLLFFLFPQEVLTIAFGNKWSDGAMLLRILAIYGFFRAASGPIAPLLLAHGMPKTLATTNFVNFFLIVLLIFPLSRVYGVSGVAYAITIAYSISQINSYYHLFLFLRKPIKKV